MGQALALVDWQGVDVTCRRIAMAQPGMGLTLNGIAQGYLTDRIVDIRRANGCDRVLADMGRSEIQLVGHRPDGQAWRIGLADPTSPARIAVTLDLADRCISTSGGYGTEGEQRDEDQDRGGEHIGGEARKDDVQPFDRREHRKRRRDCPVGVDQRRAKETDGD